ncbi:diguanylate cyclase (GGDEF)-like protein [Halanaerobium saccharolyticum]|uniref:Diguanylate cyclase (GGDEF)-like protein n=1 Tax=Halanaerobium saccharolyticum TaxID=43595 RepID=A0A4R7YPQ4_9FIRM|nr:HD domain-containing phosphohydrolase [Halanaerobium saccharolyticum]RAK05049.1 diguanylate cyclase (GGDEF)-like protein [Halanaerobium saccharolyticum]TDV98835.1 diguanylate cyclase (GGDEF)-like protein [Halanaerobium saccharolyticum]TDX51486.1 diguanylate cyclase (GGDEF)-like protein [Halanaerobium saccharolyticum]
MKKSKYRLYFYRKILIFTAAAYLFYAAVDRINHALINPMPPAERVFSASVFIIAYLFSYKSEYVKNNIQLITYFLSFFTFLHLFYYTYLQNFKLELAILAIVLIAIFNLIFDLNLLKFITNLILIIFMIFALYFADSPQVEVPLYFASYLMIAVLSFYVSYNLEQSQKRTERNLMDLNEQYQFQKTLAEISSELVNLGLDNFETKINHSLKKLGEFFEIDRSYIFKISEDGKTMSNKYEWTAAGIKSQKEKLHNLNTEKFKWWLKKIAEKDLVIIEDTQELEDEAAVEKKIFAAQNIQSIIACPIMIADDLYGFFGFDLVNSSLDFNKVKINQLNIFADVITRSISKHLDNLKIKKLSYYDSLTGLYNRRFFEAELERLDSQRQLPISIIMADLNGLKIINDSYGHKKGDQLLQKAAEILKDSLREEDILSRQGGDEFIILLPRTDADDCAVIRKRIKFNTGIIKDFKLPLSIALGQATKIGPEEDIEEIIKKADDRMYKNKLSESKSSKSNIVQGLINALAVKSSETKEHAVRMTNLAFEFGEKLALTESDQNRLSLLATLHDIGKINISEEILNKEDNLTAEEWEIVKKHTEQGYKIASSSDEFAAVAEEIFSHHEYWDGSGYPRNLEGKEIPFLARIISLVDAYDVMINDRPYSEAVSKEEALVEIKRCAGIQFDPELAAQFIEMLREK